MRSIFLILAFSALSASAQQCRVPGRCDDAILLTYDTGVADYNACLNECFDSTQCMFFSYGFGENRDACFQYRDCPSIVTDDCPDCLTGERLCPEYYLCDLPGRCQGTTGGISYQDYRDKCLEACQDTPDKCQWFSYNEDNGECIFFQDCTQQDTSCTGCTSNQASCEPNGVGSGIWPGPPGRQYTKIMITTGLGDFADEVEFVDINGFGVTQCDNPPFHFPRALSHAVGTYIDDTMMICGGQFNVDDYSRFCYKYNRQFNYWDQAPQMPVALTDAAGVQINDNEWWVAGGFTGTGFTSQSYIYNLEENGWSPGPVLPRAMGHQCMVQFNATKVFIYGGLPLSTNAYIYDFSTGQFDYTVASALDSREGAFCGLATREDGRKDIVVAGGYANTNFARSTLIYSLDDNIWTYATNGFPASSEHGITVPNGNGFLLVDGNGVPETIYRYSAEMNTFTQLNAKTSMDRYYSVGVNVPDDFYDCNA